MNLPTPKLSANRISNIHGKQIQIYQVYYCNIKGTWNVKDRWGHYSDYQGYTTTDKKEAVKIAKKRAKQDRPSMVAVHSKDLSNLKHKVHRYKLRLKDIPESAIPKEITKEEIKEINDRLERMEFRQLGHSKSEFIVR